MAFDNSNRGVLFREQTKEKAGDQDFSGQINVGGVDYWLSQMKSYEDPADGQNKEARSGAHEEPETG
jgi:hypothetical protein